MTGRRGRAARRRISSDRGRAGLKGSGHGRAGEPARGSEPLSAAPERPKGMLAGVLVGRGRGLGRRHAAGIRP